MVACASWPGVKLKILKQTIKNVPVSDDWHPSYDKDTNPYVVGRVCMYDFSNGPSNKYPKRNIVRFDVRVALWGADDTGMEKSYTYSTMREARRMYGVWNKWLSSVGVINRPILYSIGFTGA